MKWGIISVERLRAYNARRRALESIPLQIEALEMQFASVRSSIKDDVPVKGGVSDREKALLDNIDKREELRMNLEIVKREVEITEKGLAALSTQERLVLTAFYIDRPAGYLQMLCAELYCEKSKVYQIKEEALNKFTRAVYGVVDL